MWVIESIPTRLPESRIVRRWDCENTVGWSELCSRGNGVRIRKRHANEQRWQNGIRAPGDHRTIGVSIPTVRGKSVPGQDILG
jgi:hypothetical protein